MKYLILFYFCLITITQAIAQDIVKMEKSGGVYLIPCKVNGVPLKFIFDTGASDVSISLTEALFMLKNGYLKESDIKGTVYYSIANGEIAEGTRINIQKIEVGKQTLYNVEASIVHSTEAPLLFGQSAMERFGKFTMDYSNSNLIIGGSPNTSSNTTNSNTIKSVKIGTQTWMTENLKVDRFRNGDLIQEVTTDEEWKKACIEEKPAWCYYDNDPANGTKYGKLYNWYAVNDPRGIAPADFHIPTDAEWAILSNFLGGENTAGKKMKSTSGWLENGNGINTSSFSGLPGGNGNDDGSFSSLGYSGYWWSITVDGTNRAYYRHLGRANDALYRNSAMKVAGLSVRCIKD
jgi:clan AA aspartic protease (TIGR02281 family)